MNYDKKTELREMKQNKFSSLENALRLLGLFSFEEPDLSLKEIAERLSIADSTAYRLLSTLKNEGFIAKDHINNNYRLGVSVRALESVVMKDLQLYQLSTPILSSLAKKANATASLCILYEDETLYINTADSENPIYEGLTFIGKSQSVLSTSAGKVLIAYHTSEDMKNTMYMSNLIEGVPIDSVERQRIQKNGYAISYNNFFSGLTSIAVPVRNEAGQVIAAIELIGPEQRIQQSAIHRFVEMVREAGLELEQVIKRNT
ncbi:IclR family transcriptional regulator [Ammoniphilus sp. 3BR4]|uniref:IclR family transcriptional regulator n=1 Tax=Ammoniphilus sp. 3BR4 TaxID=3158265 RepID=UPI003465B6BA